jgi:cysteine desulfurase
MSTEHKAVLDTCRYLESIGFEVTYLNPERNGLLDSQKLKNAIRPDTILASIMHVNNETGVIQNILEIGKILREKGVLFHVDAAQSVGKTAIDLKKLSVDLMSLASHKVYGPKGVGALYVRRQPRVQLISQMHGGDQENKVRSGTLPTHQIVGMGEAYQIARENFIEESARIKNLRDQFEKNLSQLSGIYFSGDRQNRVPNCSNFSVDNIDAQLLLNNLNDIAISQGSACNAVDPEPSHVLIAMGLTRDAANRSFRVSVGRFTTVEEIEIASARIAEEINNANSA